MQIWVIPQINSKFSRLGDRLALSPVRIREIVSYELLYSTRDTNLSPDDKAQLELDLMAVASMKWRDFVKHRTVPAALSSLCRALTKAVVASAITLNPIKFAVGLVFALIETSITVLNNGAKVRYAVRGAVVEMVAAKQAAPVAPTWRRPLDKMSRILADRTMDGLVKNHRLSDTQKKQAAKIIEKDRIVRFNEFWRGRPWTQLPLIVLGSSLTLIVTGALVAAGVFAPPLLIPVAIGLGSSIVFMVVELAVKMKATLEGAGFKAVATMEDDPETWGPVEKPVDRESFCYRQGRACLETIVSRWEKRCHLNEDEVIKLRKKLMPHFYHKHDEFLRARQPLIFGLGPLSALSAFGGALSISSLIPGGIFVGAAGGVAAAVGVVSVGCAMLVEYFKLKGLLDSQAREILADMGKAEVGRVIR